MPRSKTPTLSRHLQRLHTRLAETKLRIEQAKLTKLEAELPPPNLKYLRYEDFPPPSPEQEQEFWERFVKLADAIEESPEGLESPPL